MLPLNDRVKPRPPCSHCDGFGTVESGERNFNDPAMVIPPTAECTQCHGLGFEDNDDYDPQMWRPTDVYD